jgi:UDP-N-acetylglucosamine/UDP-N-acetylgalactosamine 4-epimerase
MSHYAQACAALAAEPRRWLVTGAAGFIGSALLERLLSLGQSIVALDNFSTGYRHNIEDAAAAADAPGTFELIEGDICDAETCRRACEGADYVLHQAALGSVPRSLADPLGTHQANVDGFLSIILAARDAGVRRFVYASSSAVYGDHPDLPKVEANIGRPLSPYAATKRIDELYAGVVQDRYGLEVIGLRYFNVFGRRQDPDGPYAAVIPRWIERLLSGDPCVIYGDGENSRDFCYIDNAVQANILAAVADAPATNAVYNVGLGGRTTLSRLYALIRDHVARHHPAATTAAAIHEPPRPGDVLHSQAAIDAICAHLGYQPTHPIDDGLRETVDWFCRRAGS